MAKRELPTMNVDRFEQAKQTLAPIAQQMPDISPRPTADKARLRRASALLLPSYVWDALKAESHRTDTPQNAIILKGLKAIGFSIDDSDLVDRRKKRKES